jgi:phosphohistidine phosphatase SixA
VIRRARLAALLAAALVGAAAAPPADAQQALFLVRHAEKADDSEDPPLSNAGRLRSESLASILSTAGVKAIFVTQYRRTGLTAAPLASRLKVAPESLHSDSIDELVDKLRKEHAQDVVLYVGHSGSIPKILKAYGHQEPVEIGHDEYDGLWLLVPRGDQPPSVVRLKF